MSRHSTGRQDRRAVPLLFLAAVAGIGLPAMVLGADAHQAVQAKPGEIVLLRNVATRPADRAAPPGMALIVNPSPQHELDGALGLGELSDDDYASLDASPARGHAGTTTVETIVNRALGGSTGAEVGLRNHATPSGMGTAMAGPMGALTNTTGGIGNQVQGALSALPGMTPAPAGGH